MEDAVTKNVEQAGPWADDALFRSGLASYLTQSLGSQVKNYSHAGKGLTVALDAEWGAGKTFFVKRWIEDLRTAEYPVVYFDAWENDVGDEASVALMASIFDDLKSWKARVPLVDGARKRTTELAKRATTKLRKAIAPTATVLAKAVLKKMTGVAFDDVVEAIGDGGASNDVSSLSASDAEDVLDRLFELKLREHVSRKASLKAFRESLVDLLAHIQEHTPARSPMYVFVDELDRCRPPYAMKLLEEIKHIFGVPGVVFVVSTNLAQLQSSARSMYGADFDGAGYLKRLFDREYVLPAPNNLSYARIAIPTESRIRRVTVCSWRPKAVVGDSVDRDWAEIADLFDLDLRSQKQIGYLADEVIHSLSEKHGVHAAWLFFLCVLFFKKRSLLERLRLSALTLEEFKSLLAPIARKSIPIKWVTRPNSYESEERSIDLLDVMFEYYLISQASNQELHRRMNAENMQFPRSLVNLLIGELTDSTETGRVVRDYANLVFGAGFLIAE